jgi:hypothetical protein
MRREMPQIALEPISGAIFAQERDVLAVIPADHSGRTKNAPGRWLLRPASRLTFAEAIAVRETIDLRCSYLGAITNLDGHEAAVKCLPKMISANCAIYITRSTRLRF